MFGRRVSVLQPPYVLLLSPRLSAGPAAGSSALSHSVAQHLLFCASPRLCRLYGKECWLRRPAPPPLLRGQLRPLPLSRGLVLHLRVWPYLPLVPVWPVFGVQLQADLGFLAFPRLCSDALIRPLASRRPPRRRPVFDPGGSRLASRRPPRRRPVFDPGGSHSESALAFPHGPQSHPVVASGDGGSCSGIPLSPRLGR